MSDVIEQLPQAHFNCTGTPDEIDAQLVTQAAVIQKANTDQGRDANQIAQQAACFNRARGMYKLWMEVANTGLNVNNLTGQFNGIVRVNGIGEYDLVGTNFIVRPTIAWANLHPDITGVDQPTIDAAPTETGA